MKKPSARCALALFLVVPSLAAAQDDPGAAADPAPVDAAVTFAGFVATSAFFPITGHPADSDEVVFGLDEVELDVTAAPSAGLTLQADLNVFPAAGVPAMDDLVEQGYLDYTFGGGETGGFVAAGKQNVLFGVESVDPTGLYQYSFAQIPYPSNLTGFFGGYRGDSLTIAGWVTNGFDEPATPSSASPGLYASYAFGAHAIGVASTWGPVVADDPYLMFNVDYIGNIGELTLLAQANVGAGDAATRVSGLVTGNYAFSDVISATLRVDYLAVLADEAETEHDNLALTAAGLFHLADHFAAITEVKADLAGGNEPAVTGAIELLAWF